MGINTETQKNQFDTFIKIVSAPFVVIGYAGYGLYELVSNLKSAKESPE